MAFEYNGTPRYNGIVYMYNHRCKCRNIDASTSHFSINIDLFGTNLENDEFNYKNPLDSSKCKIYNNIIYKLEILEII